MPRSSIFRASLVAALATWAGVAAADDAPPPTAPAPDVAAPDAAAKPARPDRTWLFMEEPQLPASLHVVAISRVTVTNSGVSPTRPFASNLAAPGAVFELGGELGILPWLSVEATGAVGAFSASKSSSGGGGGVVTGLRFALLPASLRSTHLVVSAGYLREVAGGGNGAWGRVAFTQDVGGLRLGATVHGEHVFAAGRDALDVMVIGGASYRVAGPVRLGVEYVGQDLEEAGGDEAEGGVRHFVGPVASFELLDKRLSIVGGPAVGLSYGSPKILGRAGLSYAF